MKYLLLCSCSGQEKKATMSYNIIFPDTPLPEIIRGKEAIAKFALTQNNDHLKAISKLKGRFSYYVNIENGKILEEYDLITGKRIS